MLFLVQCGGEIAAPQTNETPLVPVPAAQATTWVSCLPPQGDPLAMPDYLCPSPAPGQYMLTLTEQELTPKIVAAIAASDDEGEVSNVVLTFESDAFDIRGRLERPFRATIQVSGRLVVRNGRIEAEMVKGKIGFISVPAWYIAEATAEVNEKLDSYFRTEYGIRVTDVKIQPGELLLTGEDLR
ncbi:MAG: hypothetical protein OXE05_03270 [Chloroflexi bacterium]|nr:hypothetical protein [Chloroflexota bacterium]